MSLLGGDFNDGGEWPVTIRYELLLPVGDVMVYKRVKRWTMTFAEEARKVLAEQLDGTIGDGDRSKKRFLNTRRGTFRVALSHRSDNSTETASLERMGVRTIHLDDPDELLHFYRLHDVPGVPSYDELVERLRGLYHR